MEGCGDRLDQFWATGEQYGKPRRSRRGGCHGTDNELIWLDYYLAYALSEKVGRVQ